MLGIHKRARGGRRGNEKGGGTRVEGKREPWVQTGVARYFYLYASISLTFGVRAKSLLKTRTEFSGSSVSLRNSIPRAGGAGDL